MEWGRQPSYSLADNTLPTPKGFIYFDVPMGEESPAPFIAALQKSIGWAVDPILDASKFVSGNLMVIVFEANGLFAVDLLDLWEAFFFFSSCFTSLYNPLGYDRQSNIFTRFPILIKNSLYYSCLRCLAALFTCDFWDFPS